MPDKIEFVEPEFEQFYAYWQTLRGAEIVPRKADFDPLKLTSLLPTLSIVQWFPPDRLLVRLVGTAIVEQAHVEPTGTDLKDLFYPPHHHVLSKGSEGLFGQPAIGLITTRRRYDSGKEFDINYAFFPFRGADDKIDIAIGVQKADPAVMQVAPDDPLKLGKIKSYHYGDIGNGIPDFSFEMAADE